MNVRAAIVGLALLGGAGAEAETQLCVYLGTSWTSDSDVTIAGRTFQTVSWTTRSFEAPPYYGLRAAHFFGESGWGVAIDFFHDKAYAADGSVAPALRRLSFSHGLNHLTLDVQRRFQLGPLRPYLGLGAGTLVPHVEAESDAASTDGYQWFRGVSVKAAAGLQATAASPVGVFAEYRFTFAHLAVSTPAGDVSTSLWTHHLIGGVFVAL
jgi:lipid A oxidase